MQIHKTLIINGGVMHCYFSPQARGFSDDTVPRARGLFQTSFRRMPSCREIYRSLHTVYFRFFIQSEVLFLTSDP